MSEIVFVDSIGKKYRSRSGRKKQDILKRFWSKIDKNGPINAFRPELGQCWVWIGGFNRSNGYASIWKDGAYIRIHRFSYEIHFGALSEGMVVEHLCNTKLCVRPQHLKEATVGENTRRAISDGLRKPGPYSKEVMSK